MNPEEFIARWQNSGGGEIANSQSFLKELCDLLDVPHPDPTQADESKNKYVFEKSVAFNNGDGTTSPGRVDLYRSGCFVLESKQGTERKAAELTEALATKTKLIKHRTGTAARGTAGWEQSMRKAREQARRYAEALPDEWPPLLIVLDVGYCFDIYADFTQSGKNYQPFPDPRSYRVFLNRLNDSQVRDKLRLMWTDPHSLDPSRKSAQVTREIAERLALLAKSLEKQHEPEVVAGFLMRCLFTMFAEDVELIPRKGFHELLLSLRYEPENFVPMVESLWEAMDLGKFSNILRQKLRHFNGSFFKDRTALPINQDQIELLIEASDADWTFVEPSIFGTLLVRALDPVERHKLGAHYTPRPYVERLVIPTIIEPLRAEWDTVYATAVQLDSEGKTKEAQKIIRDFHGRLCEIRILDPACGTANFLYVAMELMKRLEGEVINSLREFGDVMLPGVTIDPHQFLGIEINPRAAAIAELVLWIGFLQWHFRTRNDVSLHEPILKNYHNIECRDAVLAWDSIEPVFDSESNPVTRWDGRTTKRHPVTGEEVPDELARVQELRYINPRKAIWPDSDYIVGNPPFIGTARMRDALGDGYTKTVRATYKELPESCDFVMYWWHLAAERVRNEKAERFGLITTNSVRQKFNRRVISPHLETKCPLSLIFAIPDHPWVDAAMCASVRIAMTVGRKGQHGGLLAQVTKEQEREGDAALIEIQTHSGTIQPDLRIGADVGSTGPLKANSNLCNRGVCLFGSGFIVDSVAKQRLESDAVSIVREYRNGKDITQKPRNVYVLDTFGLTIEQLRDKYPNAFQHLLNFVKPERDANNDRWIRENWWQHGRARPDLRLKLHGLSRYIATVETAKHRFFVFLEKSILPDNMLVAIAIDNEVTLGVLSSRIHVCWALAAGGRLGVGNDPRYNKTRCFETFPFPLIGDEKQKLIARLAEQLDTHRKRQQEKYSTLTMTGMYNVLEKLRAGETLTEKERVIHEQGLVSILKQIHDELDAAVFDAYGWPHDLSDEEILERLVALNHERAEEESRGIIRWLRPEFQNPSGGAAVQPMLDEGDEAEEAPKAKATTKAKKQPWPKTLPERITAVRGILVQHAGPMGAQEIATRFSRANADLVEELLETLAAVGQARLLKDGRYAS